MMVELGERLQAAREEKDLSLEEVAEALRIPVNYLESLEDGAFDVFSSDLHARGFLRNYAAFLDLDPEEILDQYDELRGKPRAKRGQATAPLVGAAASRRSTLGIDALLGLVVIALLALGIYSVYARQNHQEPTPTPGPLPTPTVTPMPQFEGTAYTMDVYLDYAEHRLDVQQRVDYTNATSETLTNLMLNVHPNRSRDTFLLNEIKVDVDGELVKPEVFPLDVTLRVELPRPLNPNEHVALLLDYTLDLPKIAPDAQFVKGSFGYSNRAVSLGNWYPVVAPHRGDKGWNSQTFFEYGDPYTTEIADYTVTITTSEGIVIAGTGQETHTGSQWHYEAEQARSFAFAASDRYDEATAQVGDVTVHSYYFPANQEAGEVALQTAAQALELFTELYGPYPYASYRVVETEFSGGMEFSGLTFLGSMFYDAYDGTTRTPLIPLTAHEASHQWFYGLVGNDQATQPWLDEAFAEYSAFLYYERFLPDDTDWWWLDAVDQWAPAGKIDSLIYEFRDNREYYDAVYRRGALFMRDLRETMGDPAFFEFVQEYQRRYAYQIVSSRDFFNLVQEYTTADLVPLQEEYFRQLIRPVAP
jgi:transcriptional regulator with XRE-family HTH domain